MCSWDKFVQVQNKLGNGGLIIDENENWWVLKKAFFLGCEKC